MKKYSSVCMLYIRSTIYRLMLLLAAMAGAEALLFFLGANPDAELASTAVFLENSHIGLIFGVTFVLWSLVLTVPDTAGAQITLDRLRISHRGVLGCYSLCAALSYLILWGVQLLVVLGLIQWSAHILGPERFGPQTAVLAFYRLKFLHCLLPLEGWPIYLSNLFIILSLGATAAAVPVGRSRNSAILAPLVALLVVLLLLFNREIGDSRTLWLPIVTCLVGVYAVYMAVTEVERNDPK